MENQIPQQPAQTVVQPTPEQTPISSQPSSPPLIKSKKFLVISLGLLLLIISGGGSYLLRIKNTKQTLPTSMQQSPSLSPTQTVEPSTIPTPLPTIQSKENILPSDWTIKDSSSCNVRVPLPPDQAPYIEKTGDITWSWQFQQGKGSQLFDLSFENGVSAHYFNDKGLGSGQVMGIVSINCSQNNQKSTSQTFADAISDSVKKRNFYMGEEMSCQPIQAKQPLWNKEIIVISTNCKTASGSQINDTYYTFATENKTYLIEKIAQSPNEFVKDTTEKILNNLQFTN